MYMYVCMYVCMYSVYIVCVYHTECGPRSPNAPAGRTSNGADGGELLRALRRAPIERPPKGKGDGGTCLGVHMP